MQSSEFEDRMAALAQEQAAERYEACADKARTLQADLRASVTGGPPEATPGDDEDGPPDLIPLMLGWARYYLVRSLYHGELWREAWEALVEPEATLWSMPADNASWLYSVGAELAMRQDLPDEVVTMAMKAVEYRIQMGDLGAALMAAATACALLEDMDCDESNGPLAWFLIMNGEDFGAVPLLHGFQYAADGLAAQAANGEPDDIDPTRDLVVERIDALRDLDVKGDMEGGQTVAQTLGQIEGAAWYREAATTGERTRLARVDALWAAAERGDVNAIHEALGGVGAPPVDARRWQRPTQPTALMAASFAGHVEAVRSLLGAGADPSIQNPQRRTALVLAADQGHAACIDTLAEAGADVDRPGIYAQAALHCAAWQDHPVSVRTLIARGADLEARDMTGATPLALAASEDVPEVIAALLEAGADVQSRTNEGFTPLEIAQAGGLTQVADLLRNARSSSQ